MPEKFHHWDKFLDHMCPVHTHFLLFFFFFTWIKRGKDTDPLAPPPPPSAIGPQAFGATPEGGPEGAWFIRRRISPAAFAEASAGAPKP